MLRHSRASWCRIEIAGPGETGRPEVRLDVSNDGVGPAAPDRHSSGLANLAERLAEAGGSLHTARDRDRFALTATLPVVAP